MPRKKSTSLKTIFFIIPSLNTSWEHVQINCNDLIEFSEYLDSFSWILNVIDCYRNYAYATPLFLKSAKDIMIRLNDIFFNEGFPFTLIFYEGKEFRDKIF